MMEYMDFLRRKSVMAQPCGFDSRPDQLSPKLFDWQRDVTSWAIQRGRAGLFEDCGLGKTAQQVTWADAVAQYTDSPVLILAPLAVARQTQREGQKFGVSINVAETAADIRPGVNVTNYEKLYKFDRVPLGGVVLDESSILKAYTGKTKREIVARFKDTPYKLSCSATPAPNDLMELLNQAEFLGIMRSSEALSCWFIADQSNSGHYRLKGHAERDFWNWVASWAICIERPSDIGYSDVGYELPPLTEEDVILPSHNVKDIFAAVRERPDLSATGFHAEKRKTLKERAAMCARLAREESEQCVIWCYQNDEADELKRLLPDAVEIRGSDKAEVKERAALDFIDGKYKLLISKPSIFGYGLNFQQCRRTIFCGLDYSYEGYYQAVRRFYRFGQEREVKISRVIGENEKAILDTINRKAAQKQQMARSMAEAMKEYQTAAVHGRSFKLDLAPQCVEMPDWLRSEIA